MAVRGGCGGTAGKEVCDEKMDKSHVSAKSSPGSRQICNSKQRTYCIIPGGSNRGYGAFEK